MRLGILAGIGFSFALLSGLQMQRNQHGVDDFDQFYVGARLVFSGHLYSLPAQLELQRETVGIERPAVSSSRLPFYYAMLWPLGKMPYGAARAVWFGLMLAAAGLFVWVWRGEDRALLAAATAASLPLFAATLGQRQDLTLLLLIFAIGMRVRSRGLAFWAGVVWALLAIKIHLFLLLPVALLVRREWRMLGGFAAGGVGLLAISFAAAGPHWIGEYLRLLSDPGVISNPAVKPTLHGVVAGWAHAGAWEAALSVAVVMMVVAAGRAGFDAAIAAGLLGSFLVSNHAYLHDCAVLIPALVWLVSRSGWIRWVAVAMLTPFPYFLPALVAPVREGIVPAVLIAALVVGLGTVRLSRNKTADSRTQDVFPTAC